MSPLALVDEVIASWLESRDDTGTMPQNNFNRTGNNTFQTARNQTTTQQMFFNELRFAAARSIRTSTIILASFNIIAAFATAVGILVDSYFRERRNNRSYKFRRNGLNFVPEGEIYPLILSVGIFIQSLVFTGAQSTGLDGLFGTGCTMMALVMLPAVFLAPFIQLVFGVELTIRALRKEIFAPRGKWNVSICSALVGLFTLAMFLVADFDQSPNFCLTSLFWFVAHYSTACFGLLTAIASILIICTVVIFIKLHSSIQIEVTARVAASRMVYYLALGAISICFMLPYFYVMTFMNRRGQNNNSLNLSMVAAVVANISGLMNGGLYLFLKSNTISTIGPRDKIGEYENRRARYKIERRYTMDDTDSEIGFDNQDHKDYNAATGSGGLRRVDSEASLTAYEKEEVMDAKSMSSVRPPSTIYGRRGPASIRSFRSNRLLSAASNVFMPKAPERARVSNTASGHMRKRSNYSLFPNKSSGAKSSLTLLPATTYSPNYNDHLKPPPSMGNLAAFRHRRDSSLISSATVQIGLRFSSVDDIPPVAQTVVTVQDPHVYNLECPNVVKELQAKGLNVQLRRPAGLDSGSTTPTGSTKEGSPTSPGRSPAKDAKMKTLPPVPRPQIDTQSVTPALSQEITLSPSVYSPQNPNKAKLSSPQGAGFNVSPPGPASSPRSPPMVPPPRRAGEITPPAVADGKDAWI
ncbi:hypothetical protein QBC36DRAFT_195416 [Triangularia setosa]|uniref:Uncharacterized protein n=1 Tax=Triangularia setosa TaxID=2587417 RepID=A0AAN6W0Y7_9PEZI|nr:hypothetical protein QBC36DRAFT_195416 [Podospora setosa]